MRRRIVRGQTTRDCELEDLPHPLFRTPADIERASCFDLADHCQDVGCHDFIHEFFADDWKDVPFHARPDAFGVRGIQRALSIFMPALCDLEEGGSLLRDHFPLGFHWILALG